MPRLVAEGLAKRYGRRLLFRDLALTVREGRTLAVTGSNGAGKSTLLRMLAGLLRPSAGQVRLWQGEAAVPAKTHPLRTGLVAPYLRLYGGFTVRENLRFLARARGLPEDRPRADALLRRVGLAGRGDDPVRDFSSGMKQRAKYAAALRFTPPLLLLDEPAANLDEAGLTMVEGVIDEWRGAGRLLVVATNRPETAARCDDRLHVEDFAP